MPHLFASDVVGLLLALLLGIPFFVLPGFALGWWLDVARFRSQPPTTSWSLSVPLSVALMPIILYLPHRLGSINTVWVTLVAIWLAAVVALVKAKAWPLFSSIPKSAVLATCLWAAIASLALLDIHIGDRVYFSWVTYDHCVRAQVVSALSRADHLPISNIFVFPGHAVEFRYHYFAFLMPALVERLGAGHVSSFCALVASIVWYGIALLATIAAFSKFFYGLERHYRVTTRAWCLLLVTGPHILVIAGIAVYRFFHGEHRVFIHYEAQQWNHGAQVTSWVASGLWVPNHLSCLVACLIGCLLLWEVRAAEGMPRYLGVAAAGIAFASAAGLSVYVTMVFAGFLVGLTFVLLARSPGVALNTMGAGTVSLILASPFLLEIRSAAGPGTDQLFAFEIRRFVPIFQYFVGHGWTSETAFNLANVAALPLNYLAGFGMFLLTGILWWSLRRRAKTPLSTQEQLSIGLVSYAFLLCTLIRSFPQNDLGWRGLLPVQFLLLFWTVDVFDNNGQRTSCPRTRRRRIVGLAVVVLGILGLCTTVLDVTMLRSYTAMVDGGWAMPYEVAPDRNTGARHGSLREAYSWIKRNSPSNAVVQQNPDVLQTLALGLYSERQSVLFGRPTSAVFGGDQREMERTYEEIRLLFDIRASHSTKEIICGRYRLNYVVVQDGDPVWRNPWGYVWMDPPVFSSPYVRVFECPKD